VSQLFGDPRREVLAGIYIPSLSPPLDIVFVVVWKELLAHLSDELFEPFHRMSSRL
jgi:hypothetical protein